MINELISKVRKSLKIYKEKEVEIIMDERHKEIVEKLYNLASMHLAENGVFHPTFFVIKDGVCMPVIMHPESDQPDVATYASIVNSAAHDEDADAVVFISEQWTIMRKVDDKDLPAFIEGTERPSEAEDREEYLNLVYITAEGDIKSISGKIQISPGGVHYIDGFDWVESAHTNVIVPWRE